MNPIKFKHQNCTYAENQPEYMPLPAHKSPDGIVTSCWYLSWSERLVILLKGRVWISMLTFNNSLQPLLPTVDNPFTNPKAMPEVPK